ncbi:hypothetical protein D9758_013321 [Tetrapyrgos nigripes]|uniref:TPR-like protein n=1 Tax=Tetrapyrgos nigripes TaxID=182062 RepID=A0A8H5FJU3_9AGAR|nr:hypothetical protein D9758_013321 [Tetrapyrgos nigripes]
MSQKFKAGDPLNPYDPASVSLGQEGPEARLQAGTGPSKALTDIMSDPSKMARFMEMMKADMEDAKRRGETMEERALREKREWAEADGKAAKLKDDANKAFREGNYKEAFVLYSTCMEISPQEPVYRLNRAAAALKLTMYETTIKDASSCLEDDYNIPKAYFRRSQARYSLGNLQEARQDLDKARAIQPADPILIREAEILSSLEAKSPEELPAWVAEQGRKSLDDLFGQDGLEDLVKQRMTEAGINLDHQYAIY